jgi:hypothetical protein
VVVRPEPPVAAVVVAAGEEDEVVEEDEVDVIDAITVDEAVMMVELAERLSVALTEVDEGVGGVEEEMESLSDVVGVDEDAAEEVTETDSDVKVDDDEDVAKGSETVPVLVGSGMPVDVDCEADVARPPELVDAEGDEESDGEAEEREDEEVVTDAVSEVCPRELAEEEAVGTVESLEDAVTEAVPPITDDEGPSMPEAEDGDSVTLGDPPDGSTDPVAGTEDDGLSDAADEVNVAKIELDCSPSAGLDDAGEAVTYVQHVDVLVTSSVTVVVVVMGRWCL